MIDQTRAHDDLADERLAELMEEITIKLQDGMSVDLDGYVAAFPEFAEAIRDMGRALEALNSLPAQESHQPLADSSPFADSTLGDFRIVREIGRGGMGVVYEAEQISLKRRVALKVLPFASMLDSRRLARFKNEAQAAASLDHANIVHVYSVGCDRGVHYYAMQFVEGRSLADVVDELRREVQETLDEPRSGHSPVRDTRNLAGMSTEPNHRGTRHYHALCRFTISAADALHYAHELGVVHRDIKPSNMMVDTDGKVWLTDFGLATSLHDTGITMTGDLLGTIRYMSPEQASGENALVDRRTDVYSLGITLYELVCLTPAFDGKNRQQILRRVSESPPTPPRRLNSAVPRDLETIILKAISKEPESRYRDARAMADDLRRFVEHQPIRARRASRLEHARSWFRRNPIVSMLLFLVLGLLGALAVGATWGWRDIQLKNQDILLTTAQVQRKNAEISLRLYASDMHRAQLAIRAGDYPAAEDLLLRHVPESDSSDHRAWEWYHLWDQCRRSVPIHTFEHGLGAYAAAYSPDGTMLATGQWTGSIHLWNARTGEEIDRLVKAHQKWTESLYFTRDGKTLISAGNYGEVRSWDVATRECIRTLCSGEQPFVINDMSVSPDERLVAIGAGVLACAYPEKKPAYVSVLDVASGEEVMRYDEMIGKVCVTFSPDGEYLWAGDFSGTVRSWSTTDWRSENPLLAHEACVRALQFSPDGRVLASASGIWQDRFSIGEIKLWDSKVGVEVDRILCHQSDVRSIAFSPTGSRLVAGSADHHVSVHDLDRGAMIDRLAAHHGPVWELAYSPDGSTLCSVGGDGSVRVWSTKELTSSGRRAVRYRGHDHLVKHTRFDSTGKVALSTDWDGFVHAWDSSTGEELFRLGPFAGTLVEVAVSADNRYLAVGSGTWAPIAPGMLHLFRLGDQQEIWRKDLPDGFISGIDFSPDDTTLAVGSVHHLLLFDVTSGREIGRGPRTSAIKSLRYSPNGRRVAFTTDGGMAFSCNAKTGKLIREFRCDDTPITYGIAFFPDGKRFVTCGGERRIKIWDADSYQLLNTSRNKTPDIMTAIDVSPDGKRVVTACKDGHVYLWHPEIGEKLIDFEVASSWTTNCRFSADGKLVAGTRDVYVWDAPNVDQLKTMSLQRLQAICEEN